MSLAWTLLRPFQDQIRQKFENFRSGVENYVDPKSTKFNVLSGQKHFLRLIGAQTGKVKNLHFSWVRTLKPRIRENSITISLRFFASAN